MPALVFPLFGFSMGVLLAWVAADELAGARREATGDRGLLATVAFGGLTYGPATGYLLTCYADWCYGYWVDPQRVGPPMLVALAFANAAAPAAGFLLAARWATHHRPVPLLRLAGVPMLAATALVLAQARRLQTLGTYAQFHGDFGTEPVAGSPLGYALLLAGLVTTLGFAWTVRVLQQRSRLRRGN